MFPIVAKKEVKKEWKTGRDGFHPKLKQQVLCLSASERTTKAKHVLISCHFLPFSFIAYLAFFFFFLCLDAVNKPTVVFSSHTISSLS